MLISKLNGTEQRINELENVSEKITQSGPRETKWWKHKTKIKIHATENNSLIWHGKNFNTPLSNWQVRLTHN